MRSPTPISAASFTNILKHNPRKNARDSTEKYRMNAKLY
nr:MAG TPA: hypothetical protein [Caudoviricetes sp.]